MNACRRNGVALVGLAVTLVASDGLAQQPRGSLALKAGVTAENSEDGLRGTVAALGLTGSVALGSRWRGEAEFWLPRYLKDDNGDARHRSSSRGCRFHRPRTGSRSARPSGYPAQAARRSARS